jgi:hypothetical protein
MHISYRKLLVIISEQTSLSELRNQPFGLHGVGQSRVFRENVEIDVSPTWMRSSKISVGNSATSSVHKVTI